MASLNNNNNTNTKDEDDDNDEEESLSLSSSSNVEMQPLRPSIHSTTNNDNNDDDDDTTDHHNNYVIMKKSETKTKTKTPSSSENMGGPMIVHLHDDDNSNNNYYSSSNEILTDNGIPPRWMSQGWYDWLFPPHVPRPCQLLRRENIAVPLCYLVVGLLQGLSGPFMNVYPLDLGATEAQQTTIYSLRSLPATFKLLFGFWSDNFPLWGFRRKSYMSIGWFVAAVSALALLSFSNLTLIMEMEIMEDDDNNNNDNNNDNGENQQQQQQQHGTTRIPHPNAPSIEFLSFAILLFGTGFWFADVMGDSIVAEKAKLEPPHSRGHIQSTCYACRFFGLMVAAPLSTIIYTKVGPQAVVWAMALVPMLLMPRAVFFLNETKDAPIQPTKDQCMEIWKTVCSRAVWQPLGFVYLYNILQLQNAAWREFLKTVLNFTPNQLNSLIIIANVLVYLGVMAYKYFFITWSWRKVYIFTTLMGGVFSWLQILLITGHTGGIKPFWFALGDDAFMDFLGGIQFLPTTIMMVHLCPTGSEGAAYAMFTTVNNSALNLSSALSTMLLRIWDVSKDALARGELSGMVKLTLLTTAAQTSGVLFVKLLPPHKEELQLMRHDKYSSRWGGTLFLGVTFLSILYAIIVGLLNIVSPGWMGES